MPKELYNSARVRNLQPVIPEPIEHYIRGSSLPMKKYQNYYDKEALSPFERERPREVRGGYDDHNGRGPSETRHRPDNYDRRRSPERDRNNKSDYYRGPGDDRSDFRDKDDSRYRPRSDRERDDPHRRRSSRDERRDRDQKHRRDKVREADLNKRYDELTTDDEQGRRRRQLRTPIESSRAHDRRKEKEDRDRRSKPKPISESELDEVADLKPEKKPVRSPRPKTKKDPEEVEDLKPEKKSERSPEPKTKKDPQKIKNIEEKKAETKDPVAPVKKVASEKAQPVAVDTKPVEKILSPNSLNKSLKPPDPADFNEFDTGLTMLSSIVYIEGHDHIAVGGFKVIKIISTKSWKQVSYQDAHKSYINKLIYSVPLKMLFSCSSDGLIKSWKVQPGDKLTLTFEEDFSHPEAVYGMEVYNQDTMISCGMFKSICFWNLRSSSLSEIKTKGSSSFHSVKIIPWLGAVAVASFDQGNIWIFDLATQALKLKLEGFNKNCFVSNIEFDTNTKKIYAAGSDGKILSWDVRSEDQKLIRGREIYNCQKRFKLGGFSLDLDEKEIFAAGTGRVRDDCILIKINMANGANVAKEASVFRNQKAEKFSIAFADIKELNLILFGLSSKKAGKLAAVNRLKL